VRGVLARQQAVKEQVLKRFTRPEGFAQTALQRETELFVDMLRARVVMQRVEPQPVSLMVSDPIVKQAEHPRGRLYPLLIRHDTRQHLRITTGSVRLQDRGLTFIERNAHRDAQVRVMGHYDPQRALFRA